MNLQFPDTRLELFGPRGTPRFLPFTFTRYSTFSNWPTDAYQSHSPVERKLIVHEGVQIMPLLVGHGFSTTRPCNSWCAAAPFFIIYWTLNRPTTLWIHSPPKKAPLHSRSFIKTSTETSKDAIFKLQIRQLRKSRLVALRTVERTASYSADVEFNNELSVSLLDKSWSHPAVFTLEAEQGFNLNTKCCQIHSPSKKTGTCFPLCYNIWVFAFPSLLISAMFSTTNSFAEWQRT